VIQETREGRLEGSEGRALVWRLWLSATTRATLLVVHGLGEHSGRYRHLAEALTEMGVSVFTFDLRGHGRSEGPRGDVSAFPRFLEDLLMMEEALARQVPRPCPRFLLGHSMGGLIALHRLRTLGEGYSGAILSAPWLAVAQPPWLRGFGRVVGWLFPRLSLPGGLGPERLTRDPEMAEAWRRDPLIHTRVTGGLFREAERVQRGLMEAEFPAPVPLLFLLPGADPVVDTSVSLEFARGIVGSDVRIEILEGRLHEPLNDLGRDAVLGTVMHWLEDRIQGPGPPSKEPSGPPH